MKIYKAIKSIELEQYTRNGWVREGDALREPRVTEYCSPHMRMTTNEERNSGMAYQVYDRQVFFGDTLIFIVWKDEETISREQMFEQKMREAEAFEKQATEDAKKLSTELQAALKTVNDLKDGRERMRGEFKMAIDTNRKLEADIGKIRIAIGNLRMREILDGAKP